MEASSLLDGLQIPVELWYVIPFLICAAAHLFMEPARWKVYTRSHSDSSFALYFNIFSFTAFMGYVLPFKMGVPARVALLRWKTKLDFYRIFSIMALDGVLLYAPWGIFAFLILLFVSQAYRGEWSVSSVALSLLIAAGVFGFIIIVKRSSADHSSKLFRRLKTFQIRLRESFALFDAQVAALSVAIVLVDLAIIVVLHWSLIRFVGHELPLSAICVVTILSVFAGLVSFMPMGLGTYDAAMAFLLIQYSLPVEAALAVPVANRLGTLVVTAPIGLICGVKLGIGPQQREWMRRYAPPDK